MPVTKPLLPRQPRADGDKHKPLPHARLPSEVLLGRLELHDHRAVGVAAAAVDVRGLRRVRVLDGEPEAELAAVDDRRGAAAGVTVAGAALALVGDLVLTAQPAKERTVGAASLADGERGGEAKAHQAGLVCRYWAATPATCGVAIDVPLIVAVAVFEVCPAERMSAPGAKRSRHLPTLEDPSEDVHRASIEVVAPTVSAAATRAGDVSHASGVKASDGRTPVA